MRLLLITDQLGTPLGYDLKPANENEREGVFALATAHPGTILFADAGHRGREHHQSLELVGVQLIVPDKHKLGQRPHQVRDADGGAYQGTWRAYGGARPPVKAGVPRSPSRGTSMVGSGASCGVS
jgi:hypothetical protein